MTSLSGGLEQFSQYLLQIISNSNGIQPFESNLAYDDNEIISQVLFNTFKTFINNETTPNLNNINAIFDSINIGFVSAGFVMHHTQIQRSDLINYIYYSKLTPDGQLLRCNYHPLNIRNFMSPEEIPESFQNLFNNQDYLPNIVNVWDRGNPDTLILLTFQKVNVNVTPPETT